MIIEDGVRRVVVADVFIMHIETGRLSSVCIPCDLDNNSKIDAEGLSCQCDSTSF